MDWAEKPFHAPVLRTSERVLLHLLRLHGALSKAELARLSTMSAQGVSIIVERLFDLDLVAKGEKKRGRVGQPSTPIVLNPDGAMSVGIFVEPTFAHLILSDFCGGVLVDRVLPCTDMSSPDVSEAIMNALFELHNIVGEARWKRRVGIGLSAKEALLTRLAPPSSGKRAGGDQSSLANRLQKTFSTPVHGVNDIRAACIAEMTINADANNQNTLYLSLGLSFAAGLILEGRLLGVETKLSSNLHSLPMPETAELLVGDLASLQGLADEVEKAGFDFAGQIEAGFSDTEEIFATWRKSAVKALVQVIRAASATVLIDRVLIASLLDDDMRRELGEDIGAMLAAESGIGGMMPEISTQTVDLYPEAVGAAMLPFLKIFGMSEGALGADHRDVA